jgi:hypothetical protein
MLGPDLTVSAVAVAGASQVPVTRPPPTPRPVERTAESRLDQQQTTDQPAEQLAATDETVQRLISAARVFANLLDATGDVRVAESLSGFRGGQLNVYA